MGTGDKSRVPRPASTAASASPPSSASRAPSPSAYLRLHYRLRLRLRGPPHQPPTTPPLQALRRTRRAGDRRTVSGLQPPKAPPEGAVARARPRPPRPGRPPYDVPFVTLRKAGRVCWLALWVRAAQPRVDGPFRQRLHLFGNRGEAAAPSNCLCCREEAEGCARA